MLPLKTSRLVFATYVLVMALAAVCAFGNLSDHLFSTDDFENFADAEAVSANPSTLLSPDRAMAGRPVAEIAFLFTHAIWGGGPGDPSPPAGNRTPFRQLRSCGAFPRAWSRS